MDDQTPLPRDEKSETETPRFLVTPKRPAWQADSVTKGWTLSFAVGGILLLIAALMVGSYMLRGVVTANLKSTRTKLERRLPMTIAPRERARTRRNLERFMETLSSAEDPNALTGEFVRRANQAMRDNRLSDEEIADINQFLESVIEPQPEGGQ